jgi:cytochrome c biogenesis protein CcdA
MDLSALASLKDVPVLYAFAIGLVTAIGPCPLSANVTAIAYVSSRLSSARQTVLAGALYTCGRALTYTVLGLLIFAFGSAVMENAPALQDYEKLILGPVLIVAGAVMLELWKPDVRVGDGLKAKYSLPLAQKGMLGAFGLGAVFALAFCPYTAVMFFGLLMPLALESGPIGASFMPLFGIATGLPVLAFSALLGLSAAAARGYVASISRLEPYLRKALGAGFIAYGMYMLVQFLV